MKDKGGELRNPNQNQNMISADRRLIGTLTLTFLPESAFPTLDNERANPPQRAWRQS
jgi:hypothetical protein